MSFASTYANKPPNYKGMGITVGVHAMVFAGVMALPGIELPERLPNVLKTYEVKENKPKPIEKIVEPENHWSRYRQQPLVPLFLWSNHR